MVGGVWLVLGCSTPETGGGGVGVEADRPVAAAGDRRAFVDGDPGATRIVVSDGGPIRVLEDHGSPDRAALSPDGRWVAWVSGRSGIASIWVAPFDGGQAIQLTNVGLRHTPGQAPAGFTPPPVRDAPAFDGDALVWTGPEGRTWRVALP